LICAPQRCDLADWLVKERITSVPLSLQLRAADAAQAHAAAAAALSLQSPASEAAVTPGAAAVGSSVDASGSANS